MIDVFKESSTQRELHEATAGYKKVIYDHLVQYLNKVQPGSEHNLQAYINNYVDNLVKSATQEYKKQPRRGLLSTRKKRRAWEAVHRKHAPMADTFAQDLIQSGTVRNEDAEKVKKFCKETPFVPE